jgi:hypothetical protein
MDNIKLLAGLSFDAIKQSGEYTLLLLKTYSKYFLNGGQPSTCTGCMKDYHNKIIMKKDILEKVAKRTLIPSWNGIKYVPSVMKSGKLVTIHQHINSKFLTDEKAIELLKSGALKESDFAKLPEMEEKKKPGRKKKEDVENIDELENND